MGVKATDTAWVLGLEGQSGVGHKLGHGIPGSGMVWEGIREVGTYPVFPRQASPHVLVAGNWLPLSEATGTRVSSRFSQGPPELPFRKSSNSLPLCSRPRPTGAAASHGIITTW